MKCISESQISKMLVGKLFHMTDADMGMNIHLVISVVSLGTVSCSDTADCVGQVQVARC